MASGYKSANVDFDDIFEPRTTAKRADVGYSIDGVDISNRYEKASSGTPAQPVGYKTNGTDIGPLFAEKGGVSYWGVPYWAGESYSTTATARDPLDALAEVTVSVINNGDVIIATRRNNEAPTQIAIGNPIPESVSATDVQVRAVLVSGTAAVSNTLTNWTSLNGGGTEAGGIQYRTGQTVVGSTTDTAVYRLEFRQISDNAKGTDGNMTLSVTATVTEAPQ